MRWLFKAALGAAAVAAAWVPAAYAGSGNCGQAFVAPSQSSVSPAAGNDGTTYSPASVSGSSLTVNLPTIGTVAVGWTVCATSDANKASVLSAPLLAAPGAPTLGTANGGTLTSRTEYYKVTYVNLAGETLASSEASVAVGANQVATLASPGSLGNATGYNVYAASSSGAETKQNASPIALNNNWTEPTSGLVSGASPPGTGTAPSAYILGGGQSLATLTVGQGGNYQFAQLLADGTNYRVTSAYLQTLATNGASPVFPARWVYPGGPGYQATQNDNGNVISSALTSGGLTVTLPSASSIAAGWSVGLAADANMPLTVQTGGAATIRLQGGSTVSSWKISNSSYFLTQLQFDGATFRVQGQQGLSSAVRTITGTASDTLLSTDATVHWADPTRTTNATETLPACPSGIDQNQRTISDDVGIAGTYLIALTAPSGTTINKQPVFYLNWNGGSVTIQCDGVSNYTVSNTNLGTANVTSVAQPSVGPNSTDAVTMIGLGNGNTPTRASLSDLQSPLSRTAWGLYTATISKAFVPSYYPQPIDAANADVLNVCTFASLTLSGAVSGTSATFTTASQYPTGVYNATLGGGTSYGTIQLTRGSTAGTFAASESIPAGTAIRLTPVGPATVQINGATSASTSAALASPNTMPSGTYDVSGEGITAGTTMTVTNGSATVTFSSAQTLANSADLRYADLACIFDVSGIGYVEPYRIQASQNNVTLDFGDTSSLIGNYTTYAGEMLAIDTGETASIVRLGAGLYGVTAVSSPTAEIGSRPAVAVTTTPFSAPAGGANMTYSNNTGGNNTIYLQGQDLNKPYFYWSFSAYTTLDPGANGTIYGLAQGQTKTLAKYQMAEVIQISPGGVYYVMPFEPAPLDPVWGTTSPAVETTTSTSYVMAGLAQSFTPGKTGRIALKLQTALKTDTSGDGCSIQWVYGTGAAPSNGGSVTGTVIGQPVTYDAMATALKGYPVAVEALITSGLTLGTTYWADVQIKTVTGGTCSINTNSVMIRESN